jgi:hypothetical protein
VFARIFPHPILQYHNRQDRQAEQQAGTCAIGEAFPPIDFFPATAFSVSRSQFSIRWRLYRMCVRRLANSVFFSVMITNLGTTRRCRLDASGFGARLWFVEAYNMRRAG